MIPRQKYDSPEPCVIGDKEVNCKCRRTEKFEISQNYFKLDLELELELCPGYGPLFLANLARQVPKLITSCAMSMTDDEQISEIKIKLVCRVHYAITTLFLLLYNETFLNSCESSSEIYTKMLRLRVTFCLDFRVKLLNLNNNFKQSSKL